MTTASRIIADALSAAETPPEPLPCPFCGAAAPHIVFHLGIPSMDVPDSFHVQCAVGDCSAAGPFGDTGTLAVTVWNEAKR